ncbi:LysR family transcriptional regulator [Thalassospira sp.]|uniref:LysR family transcriptional regulator n=1 Tax=Thalassospira sp. TaxID=1912094 RepID=UPI0032ECBB4B
MISDQISPDLLRTFVAVCQQGSMSRVANQNGRTQSALSMQIKRLEGLLERPLLLRTGRGVVPTAEGELFLGYAKRILALNEEAHARVRQTPITGNVRIGLAEEVATATLPAALGRLHRAHPDIRLDITVQSSVGLGQLWDDHGLDLMIVPTSVVSADALTVWNAEMHWVCAKDHDIEPNIGNPGQAFDLVAFPPSCPWRKRMIAALVAAGIDHRMTMTSQSITALQGAIENGIGVGLLPADAVRSSTMRMFKPPLGVPDTITVQYGLYAHDRRAPVVDAALEILQRETPISPKD